MMILSPETLGVWDAIPRRSTGIEGTGAKGDVEQDPFVELVELVKEASGTVPRQRMTI
ncbi:hypothetical protein [Ktedonobacter racemifer]|uniref:hypothetical protein n=1 Tax=Ktedonobacter racemifer TaxID=363277 RepID=UPI0003150472|nr:hypothetical protein [Ktedonobacter racemifer]